VLAAIALFVALGGASYAITTLPDRSVGPRQLRSGAVTPPKLGLALGAAAVTRSDERVPSVYCPPGQVCPAIAFAPREIARTTVVMHRRGSVLILGTIEADEDAAGGPVRLQIGADASSCCDAATPFTQTLRPGESTTFTVQALIRNVGVGTHPVRLTATATGNAGTSAGIPLAHVSLTAVALPPGS
jgi:hypothetical protein